MEIYFRSGKLQKVCNSEKELRREYGPESGARIQKRLLEMDAATCLADLMKVPQARCHALKGDRAGQFAVNLKHPMRLIFSPHHEPLPIGPDGSLLLDQVTCILVEEIGDYHG